MELERCIFSLTSQVYQQVNILLVTQRFSQKEQSAVSKALQPLLASAPGCQLELVNYEAEEPDDARTALLNLGLSKCRNKYLGFLDYDDVLYPEAYELLTQNLSQTGAAIAFAGIRVMDVDVHDKWIYSRKMRRAHFTGTGLIDLFRGNFCPIHSYLIDRKAIDDCDLWFDEELTIEEDYDLLLRLCAKYTSSFDLLSKQIGDYIFKSDGSNTIHAAKPELRSFDYDWVRAQIEVTRLITTVSPTIVSRLGVKTEEGSTSIRDVLDAIDFNQPLKKPPGRAGT